MITNSLGISSPRTDARTIARGRNGITRNQSVSRIRRVSGQRPKYPATTPTSEPRPIAIAVASRPTSRETRDPQIVSARIERPKLSVPNGYRRLGGSNGTPLPSYVASSAARGTRSGAARARTAKATRMPSPSMPSLLRRYSFQTRAAERRRRAQTIFRGSDGGGVGSRSTPVGSTSAAAWSGVAGGRIMPLGPAGRGRSTGRPPAGSRG
jgi:hypothetical protein